MKKKTIFLHIGRHKSGTTSLQYFLFQNRLVLEELGYCYPNIGTDKNIAHHALANLLNPKISKGIQIPKVKQRLAREVRNFDKIILSSEGFQNIQNTKRVQDFFSDYHVIVICYFREILDYFQSAYAQRVQATNYSSSFTDFAKSTRISYDLFYNRWKNVSDKIECYFFSRESLIGNDIVKDFLARIDIHKNIELDVSDSNKNYSIGGNLLYYKLRINQENLHHKSQYNVLSHIAGIKKVWHSGFHINKQQALKIRNGNIENLSFLNQFFGDIIMKSFNKKVRCPDQITLKEDVSFFTTFESFKDSAFSKTSLIKIE